MGPANVGENQVSLVLHVHWPQVRVEPRLEVSKGGVPVVDQACRTSQVLDVLEFRPTESEPSY